MKILKSYYSRHYFLPSKSIQEDKEETETENSINSTVR